MGGGDRMLLCYQATRYEASNSIASAKLMQIKWDEIERGIRFVCAGVCIVHTGTQCIEGSAKYYNILYTVVEKLFSNTSLRFRRC